MTLIRDQVPIYHRRLCGLLNWFFVLTMVCLPVHLRAAELQGAVAQSRKLNVVLILADDLGWTDLASYGSDLYETPQLDNLARQGTRFTQNYSACTVCSPTRAALMTGKYPARLHITDWSPGQMPDNPKMLVPNWQKFLPLEETTLAELLRDAGYATATIGKWHLGTDPYYPQHQGFDFNLAGTDKAAPPSFIAPWRIPNLPEGQPGEYLTDRLATAAAQYIETVKDRPFFLYLPHFAVHTPIQGRPDLVNKYRGKLKPGLRHTDPRYAAMVESLDAAVGQVVEKLQALNLYDRTLILFTSDNGGRITQATTNNWPLRFGKASAYEGGVRVPLIVRWPGVTQPGSESSEPAITMDLFSTIIEAAGVEPISMQQDRYRSATGSPGRDGRSLLPVLRGEKAMADRELYWHYPHHQHYQLGGTMPYSAIRAGDHKLIEFHDDQRVELYDVRTDIGEQHNLAIERTDLTNQLRNQLHRWREQVSAQMPSPNPRYDHTRPQYNPKVKQPTPGSSSAG